MHASKNATVKQKPIVWLHSINNNCTLLCCPLHDWSVIFLAHYSNSLIYLLIFDLFKFKNEARVK